VQQQGHADVVMLGDEFTEVLLGNRYGVRVNEENALLTLVRAPRVTNCSPCETNHTLHTGLCTRVTIRVGSWSQPGLVTCKAARESALPARSGSPAHADTMGTAP
jgi:hypothetical protein